MSFAISPLSSVYAVAPTLRVSERVPAVDATSEIAGSRTREDRFEFSGVVPTDERPADDAGDVGNEADTVAEEPQQKPTTGPKGQELTPDERQMVAQLQLRDREVRSHEAAHKAAGGAHVGGASYTYQQGPDGQQYAIGGEVPVDLSTSGGSPQQVIAQMEQVRAAALAPGDPSPQDYAVAAAADAIAAQARRDLQKAEGQPVEKTAGDTTADQTTGVSSSDQSDQADGGLGQGKSDSAAASASASASPTDQSSIAGGSEGASRITVRAIEAYRQAQESQFAQALISQRA